MATTVNNAFAEFMKEKVNLDQENYLVVIRISLRYIQIKS